MKDDDLPQARSPAFRDALRVLGNPYASLQAYEDPEIRSLTAKERIYNRRLEDPYASLSIGVPEGTRSSVVKAPVVRPVVVPKAEFERECRRIFGQYIPAVEKGRLRLHHTKFITRNVGRAPGIRGALLAELRKFDLGDTPGFRARFNRERDVFTEAKLREIEFQIDRGKK